MSFVGQYWWLAFPLAGALGGLTRPWEAASRRRHERRIEELKIEEIKAKALASAPLAAPAAPPAEQVSAPAISEQLQHLFDTHDAVTKRWLDYELDVAKMIAYPAMSDGRQPLTAAFLRAKKVADAARPASAKKLTAASLSEYRAAVTDLEVAFDLAERDARRIRTTEFSPAERKRLDTAQQLLNVAVDQAATPAERQLAYRRVREELDGLISISDEAVDVLKKKVALQLPAAPSPPTP